MFSKKATKIDEIFTVDLTVTTYCQIDGEDFVNVCGLLRKRELYQCLRLVPSGNFFCDFKYLSKDIKFESLCPFSSFCR